MDDITKGDTLDKDIKNNEANRGIQNQNMWDYAYEYKNNPEYTGKLKPSYLNDRRYYDYDAEAEQIRRSNINTGNIYRSQEIGEIGLLHKDYGESYYDKYASNVSDLEDLNEVRAREQGTVATLGSGLGRFTVETLNTGIGNIVGTAVGIVQGIANLRDNDPNTGFWQGMWHNSVTKIQDSIRQWANELMPVYTSKSEQEMGFLRSILTDSFWAEQMASAGFTSGMLLSIALTGGMGAGSATASILKAVGASERAINFGYRLASGIMGSVSEAAMEGLNNYNDVKEHYRNELIQTYNAQKAQIEQERTAELMSKLIRANPSLLTENPIRNTEQENKIKQDVFDKYSQRLAMLDQQFATDNQNIENRASGAGTMTFSLNMAILGLSNTLGALSFLKAPYQNANRQIKKGLFQRTKEFFKGTAEGKPYGEGISKAEARATAVREMLAEGFEESNQKWASNLAEQYYGSDYDPEAADKFTRFLTKAGETFKTTYTDEETWKEWLMGALSGVTGAFNPGGIIKALSGKKTKLSDYWQGGAIEAFREGNKLAESSQKAYDEMNHFATNKKLQANVKAALFNIASKQRQMEAAARDDKYAYENEYDAQAIRTAQLFADAGKLNEFEALIGNNDNISDEELGALCEGLTTKQEDGTYISDYSFLLTENGERISDILDKSDERRQKAKDKIAKESKKLHGILKRYQRALNDIDARTGYKQNRETLGFLAWGVVQYDNWKERIKEMFNREEFQGWLQDIVKTTQDAITKGDAAKDELKKETEYNARRVKDANIYATALDKLRKKLAEQEALLADNSKRRNKKQIQGNIANIKDRIKRIETRLKNTRSSKSNSKVNDLAFTYTEGEVSRKINSAVKKTAKSMESFSDVMDFLDNINAEYQELDENQLDAFEALNDLFDTAQKEKIGNLLTDMRKCLNASNNLENYINSIMDNPEAELNRIKRKLFKKHNEQEINLIDDEIEASLQEIAGLSTNDLFNPQDFSDDPIFLRIGDADSNTVTNKQKMFEKLLEQAKKRLRTNLMFAENEKTPKEIDELIDNIIKRKVEKLKKENKNIEKFLNAYELSKQFSNFFENIIDNFNIENVSRQQLQEAVRKAQLLFEAANIVAFSKGIHPILLSREDLLNIAESIGFFKNQTSLTDKLALSFVNRIYNHIENKLNQVSLEGKITKTEDLSTETMDGVTPATKAIYTVFDNILQEYDKFIIEENNNWQTETLPSPTETPSELSNELLESVLNDGNLNEIQKTYNVLIMDLFSNKDLSTPEKISGFGNVLYKLQKVKGLLSVQQRIALDIALNIFEKAGYKLNEGLQVGSNYSDTIQGVQLHTVVDKSLPLNAQVINEIPTPKITDRNEIVIQEGVIKVGINPAQPAVDDNNTLKQPIGILSLHSQEFINKLQYGVDSAREDFSNVRARTQMDLNHAFEFVNSGKLAEEIKKGHTKLYGKRLTDEHGEIPDTIFLYIKTSDYTESYQMVGYIYITPSESKFYSKNSVMVSSIFGETISQQLSTGLFFDNKEQKVKTVNIKAANAKYTTGTMTPIVNEEGKPLQIVHLANGIYAPNSANHIPFHTRVGEKSLAQALKDGDAHLLFFGKYIGKGLSAEEFNVKTNVASGICLVIKDPSTNKWTATPLNYALLGSTTTLNRALQDKNSFIYQTLLKDLKKQALKLTEKVRTINNTEDSTVSSTTDKLKTAVWSTICANFIQNNTYSKGLIANSVENVDKGSTIAKGNSYEISIKTKGNKLIAKVDIYSIGNLEDGKRERTKIFDFSFTVYDSVYDFEKPEDISSKITSEIMDKLASMDDTAANLFRLKLNPDSLNSQAESAEDKEKAYNELYENLASIIDFPREDMQPKNTKILATYTDEPSSVNISMESYSKITSQAQVVRTEVIHTKSITLKIGSVPYSMRIVLEDGNKKLQVGIIDNRQQDRQHASYKFGYSDNFNTVKSRLDPSNILTNEEFERFMISMIDSTYHSKELTTGNFSYSTIIKRGEKAIMVTYNDSTGRITTGEKSALSEDSPSTESSTQIEDTPVESESSTDMPNSNDSEDSNPFSNSLFDILDDEDDEDMDFRREVRPNADIKIPEGNYNGVLFLQQVLKEISHLLDNRDMELLDFILQNISKRLKVRVLDDTTWEKFKKVNNLPDNTLGATNTHTNTMFLCAKTDITTLLHEMAHAATISYLKTLFQNNKISEIKGLEEVLESVLNLYKTDKDKFNGIDGLGNFINEKNKTKQLIEFIAEVAANRKLQTLLKSIKEKKQIENQEKTEEEPSGLRKLGNWIKNKFVENDVKETVAEDIVEYTLFNKFKANITKLPKVAEANVTKNRKGNLKYIVKSRSKIENGSSVDIIYDTNTGSEGTITEISTENMLHKFNNDGTWTSEYRELIEEFESKTGNVFNINDTSPYGLNLQKQFFKLAKEKGYSGIDFASYDNMTFSKYSINSLIVTFGTIVTEKQVEESIKSTSEVVGKLDEQTKADILQC